LDDYLNPDAPVSINKGGVINKGINKELDKTRDILNNSKKTLDEILEREIEKTGISSLKISFNNVFGFYLEVTNSHKDKVPTDWIRKQTLVNAERYITDELKIHENQILNAEEKILEIEYMEFNNLVRKIQTKIDIIQKNASCIAYLDCLLSFSHCADELTYVKPIINNKNKFFVKNSRHPVIEHTLDDGKHYIPNDIELNDEDHQILMITGPNMSGKSAILRQVALIAILAQIGSYVPATELEMGFFDRIFTRVGASDNISQGESTFMVEMLESASIVNNISDKSLVVLDEIGRGTSTYDGISIAWGITQFLHENINRPKTLFATHYHELNMMADKFKRIKNYNVQVKETSKDVIFLRKLIPGGSAHSFGIHVAKMAGMPEKIINISKKILKKLEKSHSEKNKFDVDENSDLQLSFFSLNDDSYQNLKGELESIDMDNMTPIEALVKLSELKQKINKDDT
jgi:DNA mismatch repair protein MutS